MSKVKKRSANKAVSVHHLEGQALDWVVDALMSAGEACEILYNNDGSDEWEWFHSGMPYPSGPDSYSTNPVHCSALIDKFDISVIALKDEWVAGFASLANRKSDNPSYSLQFASKGKTWMIAACRAIILREYGRVLHVPEELIDTNV